ncbi:MAG: hypothetical protein QXM89_00155 [Candidatus Bathyarchaeia archaeon]
MSLKSTLEELEVEFLNRDVKIKILKSLEGATVLGGGIKPYEPDSEVKLKRWIALKLVEKGVATFKQGEELTSEELTNIHWREGLQPSTRLSEIPGDFYQKLRLYLRKVKHEAEFRGSSQLLEKYKRLARDIVDSRTRKIVNMAASLNVPQELLQLLTVEEKALYEEIKQIIEFWRSYILDS